LQRNGTSEVDIIIDEPQCYSDQRACLIWWMCRIKEAVEEAEAASK
jgi:hypothetical protein